MGWSGTAPSVSFASSTVKEASKIWNNYAAYPMKVWTARGSGDTYYVKVTVNWGYGEGTNYTRQASPGVYWYVGSDKDTHMQPSSPDKQTWYYTGTRGSSGTVKVGISPNSSLTSAVEVTSANIPAATYTVSYLPGSYGSGASSTVNKTYNVSLTLAGALFTRTGYTQTGWSTTNGGGKSFDLGGTYSGNVAIALYPFWTVNTYTISYNANGGSGAPGSQTKTYGTNLTLSSTIPTRTGYSFLGWSKSSTATTATYSAGGTFTDNANTTLYAVWKINTWTVSYNGNGNTGGSTASQTKTYNVSLSISANGFTRTNYSFVTWNTAADGSGTNYAPGATYTGNAGMTLYAQWKKNNIPVFVNKDGVIYQVEKAYANVGGVIKECTVYANVGGVIKEFT